MLVVLSARCTLAGFSKLLGDNTKDGDGRHEEHYVVELVSTVSGS